MIYNTAYTYKFQLKTTLVKAIWKPEVYFPNAKDAEFQYVTVPNVLVRIDPGGQILYMLRYITLNLCTFKSHP